MVPILRDNGERDMELSYERISTNQESLIFWIDIIQKDSSMQPLLLNLWVLSQDFSHISDNILCKENHQPLYYKGNIICKVKGQKETVIIERIKNYLSSR